MVKDGIILAAAFAATGLALGHFVAPLLALPLFIAAAFLLFFFRDPERKIPSEDVLVSPADGQISLIRAIGDDLTRISIFLSVFDVHVNRSPVAGTITAIDYSKGKFQNAIRPEASDENERNRVEIRTDDGGIVVFSQIAGLLARRIVFHRKVGDRVQKGERLGLIKFGSRTDVIVGREWKIVVQPGQNVMGGSTVLARRTVPAWVGADRDTSRKSDGAQEEREQ